MKHLNLDQLKVQSFVTSNSSNSQLSAQDGACRMATHADKPHCKAPCQDIGSDLGNGCSDS